MVLSGEVDLTLPDVQTLTGDRRIRLRRGQFVYYPSHFAHTITATSDAPANYLMFRWLAESANTGPTLAFGVFDLTDLKVGTEVQDGFSTCLIFDGPTAYLQKLQCHSSTLQPGKGYEPHSDKYDVAIIVLEGEVETLGEKAEPHDVILFVAGDPHGMHNAGQTPARYVVFEFHGHKVRLTTRLRDPLWPAKKIAIAMLPTGAVEWLRLRTHSYRAFRKRRRLRVGRVDFGGLRRLTPISDNFGYERGLPITRYYIEKFLGARALDIRGHVLEIGDDRYIRKFGGDRVAKTDVLHYVEGHPEATIVADLSRAGHIPSNMFDCIIFTQTLQMIYEMRDALSHLHRILKPGGTVLMTCHGTSKIDRQLGTDPWGEYWRLTAQSAKLLFEEHFPARNVDVTTYGNVLAAIACLHGLAAEELKQEELDYTDPEFEVLIAVRAVKQ